MSLSSARFRGIAGWRLAIHSKTDWLSLTFWADSSVWIICSAFFIAFISARWDEHHVPAGMA